MSDAALSNRERNSRKLAFCELLASGEVNTRKVDGRQTPAIKPIDRMTSTGRWPFTQTPSARGGSLDTHRRAQPDEPHFTAGNRGRRTELFVKSQLARPARRLFSSTISDNGYWRLFVIQPNYERFVGPFFRFGGWVSMKLKFCVACGWGDADQLQHHHLVARGDGGRHWDGAAGSKRRWRRSSTSSRACRQRQSR
jgi:hypothetical protein